MPPEGGTFGQNPTHQGQFLKVFQRVGKKKQRPVVGTASQVQRAARSVY